MIADTPAITDAEVIGYVYRYLDGRDLTGLDDGEVIEADTVLASLGLDSISLVELLLSAREEFAAGGRLPASVALTSMPSLERVADLTALFRELAGQPT